MRIAAATPVAAPPGWSPGAVRPATSTRASGLVRGALDAWLGRTERSDGVPLTSVQVEMLAPFFAREAHIDEAIVLDDLRHVRVVVGGPAADAGNTATTIGRYIYVSDAERATSMLSWDGRRWLTHELGHAMQWRRLGGGDRAFLDAYVGAFAAHDGKVSGGGLMQALHEWQRRRDAGVPTPWKHVPDLLHDFHPMEQEAERMAIAFRDANP